MDGWTDGQTDLTSMGGTMDGRTDGIFERFQQSCVKHSNCIARIYGGMFDA